MNEKKIRKNLIRKKLIIKKITIETIYIIIGCIIMSVGISSFLLPNQLSSGGLAGLATIIYYIFKTPLGVVMLILNIPLFIMAFIKIGKEKTFKGIARNSNFSNFFRYI